MAITTFNDSSTTAASNIDVNGTSIQGLAPVSNFDNALRELMAIYRRDLDNGVVASTKSANYTAVANDNNAILRFTGAYTLSLTAAATLGSRWHIMVVADGGAVTIDPNGAETINGAATIVIPDGRSAVIWCTGSAFFATEDHLWTSPTVDVASATTTDIGAAASWNVRITGTTTTITGFGTAAEGTIRFVRMAGAQTLTHNATSLILPTAANITTAANDCLIARSLGSGNWIVMHYQRASGHPVKAPILTVEYESAQQTITSAGGLTLAHGLGVKPKIVALELVCLTAEANYSVGVTLQIYPSGLSTGNTGCTIITTATNVFVKYGSNATVFAVNNNSTGANAALTNANWALVVRAYA